MQHHVPCAPNRALGLLCAIALCALLAGPTAALARSKGGFQAEGGYAGPGPSPVTVQQAEAMRDNSRVTLEGHIIQSLGDEKYLFRDATGTIRVEIDDDDWAGQTIGPDDLVQIQGKLDKDWNSVEIEVKRVRKK